MTAVTDSVVLALLLYFIYRGWSQGITRTLLGPVAFLLSCVIAVIYYSKNHNLFMALAIGILGPWILTILFSLALNVWHRSVSAGKLLSYASRGWGAGISLVWGSIHLLLILLFIVLFPGNARWLEGIRQDIFKSRTYSLVDQWTRHLVPRKTLDIRAVSHVLRDPDQLQNIQSSQEYKAVLEDKTIQELLTDEGIAADIKDKDFVQLMANPKIQALLENPELLQKILDLNVKIMEQGAETHLR